MNQQRETGYLLLTAFVTLSSVAVSVAAQEPANRREQNAQSNSWNAQFLEQLDLTREQKPKFLAIQRAMTAKWAEFQKMPPQERKPKQEAFYKARHAELAKLLTPDQMAKYREIRSQRWKRQSTAQSAGARPTRTNSTPSARPDYSGKDVGGIEDIVEAAQRADEPWRKQAEQRIDRLRKAELEIRIVDAKGRPVPNVPVRVRQQRHAFHFGGVVSGPRMHAATQGQQSRRASPERYKRMFLDLGFNTAGFGNYLKYRNRAKSMPHLPALFAWFQEHDIPVRGHCLMWPGGNFGNFLTDELTKLVYVPNPDLDRQISQRQKSRLTRRRPFDELTPEQARKVQGICERMTDEASTQWPVFEWDVINETRANHVIQDLLGRDVMVDWFKIARQNTKERNALLYLNENQVISDPAPGNVTRNMRRSANEVRYLLDKSAPLSALGFQSRFAKKTPPETIYRRLQYFETFNLPIAATEFEMKSSIGSEQAKAAMTEQAMTVLFSHKLVNGIHAWTIQGGGKNADRAIVNPDGNLNLRGKVWMYLMKNRWWTDETLTTDANGMVRLRGFKGDYTVTLGKSSATNPMKLRLAEDRQIKATLPTTRAAKAPAPGNGEQASSIIGRKGFVHVEKTNGVWSMVNADGTPFIPLGMNHVGPGARFAKHNRAHWAEKIGGGILKGRRVDYQSPGAKTWLELIAADHKAWGFNTLAFHHPHPMPTEHCNELGLYYFGKLRMSHVHPERARTMSRDKRFPDVFDPTWVKQLDAFVARYTAKHRDSKYLLGYSYDDLPAYTIHSLKKPVRRFQHHPWIMDILSRPGETEGKRQWVEVLKAQYGSPAAAAKMYGVQAATWEALLRVEEWGMPADQKRGSADQALMNAHHDAIRKHDPNHLILGDKIQNARPQPDWVWAIVKRYVDVILIQDYDFFTPAHERKLIHIHKLTGKPIINGDHAYGFVRPNMDKVKGVPVPSMEDKGKQYAVYLRGIMNLPFILGWQTCGYLETWGGTKTATGKCQTGYFDPMGRPLVEGLRHAKEANEQALEWHRQAGTRKQVYSTLKRKW